MSESASIANLVLAGVATACFGLAMWILSSVSGRIVRLEQAIREMSYKCERHAERLAYVEAKTNGAKQS